MSLHEVDFSSHCWCCEHKLEPDSNGVCNDCLSQPMVEDSKKPINFKASESSAKFPYLKMEKIRDFVYCTRYDSLDYEFAKNYYISNEPNIPKGGCSAIRNGNFFGRNLDWTYDNLAEFIVNVSKTDNRYSSIGVASGFRELDNNFAQSGKYSDIYKVLPFQMYDGINEKGLCAAILVVPAGEETNRSIPLVSKKDSINGLMLVRYILDRFETVTEACEYIRDYVEVWFSERLRQEYGYELHYILTDRAGETRCLEFIDGETVILDINDAPFVTNFHLDGVTSNYYGEVFTPETQHDGLNAITVNHIEPYGSGLERYNVLNYISKEVTCRTPEMMLELMSVLHYSRAYKSYEHPSKPYWYTEFVGGDLTVASPVEDYTSAVTQAAELYSHRNRKYPDTWHTVHTAVYDVVNGKAYYMFQEKRLTFRMAME